jgi:oxalate decarboxylase
MKPVKENSSGSVKIADSSTFKVSKTIAAGLVTLQPGALRDMHWHPQCRRMAVLDQGQGQHDGVQHRP